MGSLNINSLRIQNYVLHTVGEINQEYRFKVIYLGIITKGGVMKYKILSDVLQPDIEMIAVRLISQLDSAVDSIFRS